MQDEGNPYESVDPPAPAERRPPGRVTAGHILTALAVSTVAALATWISLILGFFAHSSEYWPGWACAAPAVALGALVFRSLTVGVIGKAIAARVGHLRLSDWAAWASIVAAMLTLGLRVIYLLVIRSSPEIHPDAAMRMHYLISQFLILPGFLCACVGLAGGIYHRRDKTIILALIGAFFCSSYFALSLWKIYGAAG